LCLTYLRDRTSGKKAPPFLCQSEAGPSLSTDTAKDKVSLEFESKGIIEQKVNKYPQQYKGHYAILPFLSSDFSSVKASF